LTARLLTTFKQQIREMRLVPGGGGCFELIANGERLYSKLETGKFPDEQKIVDLLTTRLR
jgi:selenoprotein W-related protein